jgi:hypothetical protein
LPSNLEDLAADLREATPLPAPTVTECYGHAWRQLKRHFWKLLLVALVQALFYVADWALSAAGDLGDLLSFRASWAARSR